MSSTKSARNKKHRKQTAEACKETQFRRKKMLDGVLAAMAILSFVIAVLQIWPRMSVSNGSAIDPNDPFSTPFNVTNEGYLPLFCAQFLLAMREIKTTQGGGIIGDPNYRSRTLIPEMKAAIFWPNEVYGLYLGRFVKTEGNLQRADIAIVVQYRPFGIPLTRERLYRFVTQRGPDNRLYWLQRPRSD